MTSSVFRDVLFSVSLLASPASGDVLAQTEVPRTEAERIEITVTPQVLSAQQRVGELVSDDTLSLVEFDPNLYPENSLLVSLGETCLAHFGFRDSEHGLSPMLFMTAGPEVFEDSISEEELPGSALEVYGDEVVHGDVDLPLEGGNLPERLNELEAAAWIKNATITSCARLSAIKQAAVTINVTGKMQ